MEPLFPGIARKSGNPISDFINLPSSYFRGQQAPASLKRAALAALAVVFLHISGANRPRPH